MTEQERVARCAITVANLMKEYAKLGTDDYYEVGSHLKTVMSIIAGHLNEENQNRFAEWLLKKTKES